MSHRLFCLHQVGALARLVVLAFKLGAVLGERVGFGAHRLGLLVALRRVRLCSPLLDGRPRRHRLARELRHRRRANPPVAVIGGEQHVEHARLEGVGLVPVALESNLSERGWLAVSLPVPVGGDARVALELVKHECRVVGGNRLLVP